MSSADTDNVVVVTNSLGVDTRWPTFNATLNAAEEGDTITLLDDVVQEVNNGDCTITKSITVDLNGKTLRYETASGNASSVKVTTGNETVVPGSKVTENGITNGFADGTFGVDTPCTRAQAVAFLFRYAAANGMEAVTLQELVGGYSDADSVPGYALSAFNWALAGGIVTGNNGDLMPNNACTRAQIVTFLYRLLGK